MSDLVFVEVPVGEEAFVVEIFSLKDVASIVWDSQEVPVVSRNTENKSPAKRDYFVILYKNSSHKTPPIFYYGGLGARKSITSQIQNKVNAMTHFDMRQKMQDLMLTDQK
jgi:hypothetical protein